MFSDLDLMVSEIVNECKYLVLLLTYLIFYSFISQNFDYLLNTYSFIAQNFDFSSSTFMFH